MHLFTCILWIVGYFCITPVRLWTQKYKHSRLSSKRSPLFTLRKSPNKLPLPVGAARSTEDFDWESEIGYLSQSPPSLSLLPFLFSSSVPSVKPSSVSLCSFRVCSPPCARSCSSGCLRVLAPGRGEGRAKHLSAENFPASCELQSTWFFIHEPERHAFFTCHAGGGGRRREKVGGCVIAPSLSHWSASFLRVNERPEAKSLKRNGSWIQTRSLIKQWINVNIWRHALNGITWAPKVGAVQCWNTNIGLQKRKRKRKKKLSSIGIKEMSLGKLILWSIFRYFHHTTRLSVENFYPYRSLPLKFKDTKYGSEWFPVGSDAKLT